MKSDNKDKLSEEDVKTLDEAVESAKKVASDENADKEALETAGKELSDKIMPIGAKMYEQASKETQSKDNTESEESNNNNKSDKDEPVEGEVVDDKKG